VQTAPEKSPSLKLVSFVLFALIVLFHVSNAVTGRSLIRANHLGTALTYAQQHIDLLRPTIVGFNATGTPTALEFPLWQAVLALVFKLTSSTWDGWGNLLSLCLFATCLWPFFQLARSYSDERTAWWAMVFFLAEPLVVTKAGEAGKDGLCLVATIWFLFAADRMSRTGKLVWWLPATLFGVLSAVLSVPYFLAAGFCSAFMLLLMTKDNQRTARTGNVRRLWVLLASSGAVPLAVLAAWTHHANSLAALAEYPYTELRLSKSPFMTFWFFGDLHYRLRLGPWIKGGWRFLHATMGALPMVALFVPALFIRGNRLGKLWLLGAVCTTLIFTHLVLVHWGYYLMYCPAVALLCGATLARLEPFFKDLFPVRWLGCALTAVVLGFSAIDGIIAMKIAIDYDPFPKQISSLIRQHTQPTDKLVLYTCTQDWGGEQLFRSGRQGLCVMNYVSSSDNPTVKGLHELLTNDSDLSRLKQLGYTKLVMVSESPVRFAAEAINPGSKRRRQLYPQTISKIVDNWPVVYRSEDLLIKEIP